MRSPLRPALLALVLPVLLVLPAVPAAGVGAPGNTEPSIEALHASFPEPEWERAELVARCESGLRADAVSPPNSDGTRDWGLFQLNDGGTLQGLLRTTGGSDVSTALDPAWSARAAKALHDSRGWQPWTCAARLGIVSGLWSSVPGPNGGDRAFDPTLAPDRALAVELFRQSEFSRTQRREAAEADLALTLRAQSATDDALSTAKGDLAAAVMSREAAEAEVVAAGNELASAHTFVMQAGARASELDAELERVGREHAESQRQLGAEVRATYMGSRTESLRAVKEIVTSDQVEDALQAQGFVGEALEGQGRLAVRAGEKRREVAELTRGAREVREQASRRENAARTRHAAAEDALQERSAEEVGLAALVRTATEGARRAQEKVQGARAALDQLG